MIVDVAEGMSKHVLVVSTFVIVILGSSGVAGSGVGVALGVKNFETSIRHGSGKTTSPHGSGMRLAVGVVSQPIGFELTLQLESSRRWVRASSRFNIVRENYSSEYVVESINFKETSETKAQRLVA